MTHHGCFQLDVHQQTVIFFPHYLVCDYSDPLIISHSLSGPNDVTKLITNMRETHETYGPGSYEYPLAFCLREAFAAGVPAFWAFSSSTRDLFPAIPKVIEEGVYPFCDELKRVYDFLGFAELKYVAQPEPTPDIPVLYRDYRDIPGSAQMMLPTQFTSFKAGLQAIVDAEERQFTRCGDIHAGQKAPKQTKDFRSIGKSHNAKKRW